MDAAALPTILEIKETLAGQRKEFRCRLVERAPGHAAVLFVSTTRYDVAGLVLPPGTVTLGHFWDDRDFNVYHWLTPGGQTLAHYFNLSADTSVAPDTIRWRDLAIDVLVRPGAAPVVLDEDELPGDLDPRIREDIDRSRQAVLAGQAAVVAELEAQADALWPRLFGARRP
jgi:predicted RNA-binding protein associated with RNAse of E/G family